MWEYVYNPQCPKAATEERCESRFVCLREKKKNIQIEPVIVTDFVFVCWMTPTQRTSGSY